MTFSRQIFSGIMDVSERFQGILLDAYGVFWGGNACGVLSGAKEIMEKWVSKGKVIGILSNSTQLASSPHFSYLPGKFGALIFRSFQELLLKRFKNLPCKKFSLPRKTERPTFLQRV
jgi:hypothetical protein